MFTLSLHKLVDRLLVSIDWLLVSNAFWCKRETNRICLVSYMFAG